MHKNRRKIYFICLIIILIESAVMMYKDVNSDFQEAENENGNDNLTSTEAENQEINFSDIFDYETYVKNSGFIPQNTDEDLGNAFIDFLENGMDLAIVASDEFDPIYYRANNQDLAETYGEDWMDYYLHYVLYGKSEGRKGAEHPEETGSRTDRKVIDFSIIYDNNYYLENNEDVQEVIDPDDKVLVLEHFIRYGLDEGRIASKNMEEIYKSETKLEMLKYDILKKCFGE